MDDGCGWVHLKVKVDNWTVAVAPRRGGVMRIGLPSLHSRFGDEVAWHVRHLGPMARQILLCSTPHAQQGPVPRRLRNRALLACDRSLGFWKLPLSDLSRIDAISTSTVPQTSGTPSCSAAAQLPRDTTQSPSRGRTVEENAHLPEELHIHHNSTMKTRGPDPGNLQLLPNQHLMRSGNPIKPSQPNDPTMLPT
jgi:hypothetical protein